MKVLLLTDRMQRGGAETHIAALARGLPAGWEVSVLSSHTEFEWTFGRTADKKRKLYNGMLKCDLLSYGMVKK